MKAIFATTAFLIFSGLSAQAATISFVDTYLVPEGGMLPGSSQNYDLFGWGGSPNSVLTNFTVTPAGSIFGPGSSFLYSTIKAPGGSTAFYTGVDYFPTTVANASYTMATFASLSGGDFKVYILDDNTDNNFLGNENVGLMVNGVQSTLVNNPSILPQPLASGGGVRQGLNEISVFLITGALTTDVFQVQVQSSTRPTIGGLSFDTAEVSAVPEPASFAMLGLGLAGAAALRRRKKKIA